MVEGGGQVVAGGGGGATHSAVEGLALQQLGGGRADGGDGVVAGLVGVTIQRLGAVEEGQDGSHTCQGAYHAAKQGVVPLSKETVQPLFKTFCTAERGPHSANSTFVVLENTAKLKPVSKLTSF